MRKKSVGFFGGSFDPIHFGHLALAIQLMEAHSLDHVLFCPAFCSPFKVDRPPHASASQRLEMLKLALDIPQFQITTHEIDRQGPSYTIDTIRALQTPDVQFRLLLSDEAAAQLYKWKGAVELFDLAPPLTAPRDFKISSTDIRARLKKGLYCGHLTPARALAYIHEKQLYTETT